MEKWTFVLTKLDHTPIGEVHDAYERKVNINLSKPSTASFTIRQDNSLLLPLFAEDTLLQVWQGSTLRFWGPVLAPQLKGEEGQPISIAISAVDPAWRLSKRLAGKSTKGTTAGPSDKINIAEYLIGLTNAENSTEISLTGNHGTATGTYVAGPYKPILACVNELAHGIDGFDWVIVPVSGTPGTIGRFSALDVIGEEKPNAIFEFGVGKKNMRSISFLRDLGGILNQAYHIPDEGLEGAEVVVSASDAPSIAARGLYEETVELNGVTNTTLRTQWVENQVAVRKEARRVIALTSGVQDPNNPNHVPRPGTDYWLGDTVTARAVIEGSVIFSGQTRVYSIEVELSDSGTAKVTPVLVEEAE